MLDGGEIESLRGRAFAIAYRMLGSVAEAEDVVQEAMIRLHEATTSGQTIESPRAWLATVVTRLSIDELRSARVRRESYVGEWLPEPLLADARPGPQEEAELADSLSFAFLVLLEKLTPEQRAVLLLHDVFDYGYTEIAAIVDKSEPNVRQIATRARRAVAEGRPSAAVAPERRDELADRFFAAARDGELEALEALLAEDVVLHGDGGGRAPALARSLTGRNRVGRTLRNWWRAAGRAEFGFKLHRVDLNGQPGALIFDDSGQVISAMALDIRGGEIVALHSIVNPEKLAHLGPVGDLGEALRRD